MKYVLIGISHSEKRYYFTYPGKTLVSGDYVLVENVKIIEIAKVLEIFDKEDQKIKNLEKGEGKILRKITQEDLSKITEIKQHAQKFMPICEEKIKKFKLPMKLLDADLSYDEKKLTFYFGSESRVDFRYLVLDLIKSLKKIIRLQQIGSRDEAKIFGGFGSCGRELCCKSFLKNIGSITLDMAKVQNLSTSISKISGLCGKLMCCLSFELDEYVQLKKKLPLIGQEVKTKEGKGMVIEQRVLIQKVIVKLNDGKLVEVSI